MMKPLTLIAVLAATAAASGCSSIGGKQTPDEFKVVTKAPLVVPPDYSLRPPKPGEARPQEASPESEAKTALFGQDVGTQASEGEQLLVAKAGADAVDPTIRDQIDRESGGLTRKSQSLSDRIVSFGKGDGDKPAPIDAEAEKERLEREEAVKTSSGGGEVTMERDGGGVKLPGL
jgi:hypothetical protein